MATFQFKALRQNGETFSGVRDALDKHALVEALRSEGATALSVSPVQKRSRFDLGSLAALANASIFSRAPSNEKILFARNLSAMIAAGLPLSRALAVLQKQTRNAAMKKTIQGVSSGIEQGHSLSAALAEYKKVFSPIFIAMVRSGEESGTLAKSLQVVATQMEHSYSLTKKVRGAMIYPAIVIVVMIGIGVLMLIFVVPTLSSTFASLNTQLPLPTQIIIRFSNGLIAHPFEIALGTLAAVVAFVAAISSHPGKKIVDRVVLMLPVIGGIVAKVNAARTARTLSSLLSAGVSALAALEITNEVVQNSRFRPIIKEAHDLVEKGKPLSDAFVRAENIYPIMFAEMAAVGEETGDMSGMLERVAIFYEEEVEQQTKDLSTIIEPVLMVIIGAGVGFFALAMIMPIYSLSGSIG